MSEYFTYDVLIIGSGAAGLSLALRLAQNARVAVLSKRELTEGSTFYAQGGVAAVMDPGDTLQAHIQDTLRAGAGLCDPETVKFVVENGPDSIKWLIDQGVNFSRRNSEQPDAGYHLTREGGHTHRRVIHAADATGRAIESSLESLTFRFASTGGDETIGIDSVMMTGDALVPQVGQLPEPSSLLLILLLLHGL